MTILEEYGYILNWFNEYYTIHEQKYRRLMALNKTDDNGADPKTLLLALYSEAELKRLRIQQIEKALYNEQMV